MIKATQYTTNDCFNKSLSKETAMRKVHEKVIEKFLQREKIRTANFSVEIKAFYLVDKPGQFELVTVLYSYALPVAFIDTNGYILVGDYIRQISVTTTAQIRALITMLKDADKDFELMTPKEFEKAYSETV